MSDDDWQDDSLSVFGMERQRRDGPHLLTCLNTGDDGQFALPDGDWTHRIDTTADPVTCEKAVTGVIDLPGQSVQVFLAVSS